MMKVKAIQVELRPDCVATIERKKMRRSARQQNDRLTTLDRRRPHMAQIGMGVPKPRVHMFEAAVCPEHSTYNDYN